MLKIRKIWKLILLVVLVAGGSSIITLVVVNSQHVAKPKIDWTKLEDTKSTLQNLYRLHKEEGVIWEKAGIVADYVEWKITPQEREGKNGIQEILVVWRAKFRNISDKKKSIFITFELYDRDNFLIAWDSQESFFDLARSKMAESEQKELEKKFREFSLDPDPIIRGAARVVLYKSPYTLSPKEEEVVKGELWIPKGRASSVYKSALKLGTKEINE